MISKLAHFADYLLCGRLVPFYFIFSLVFWYSYSLWLYLRGLWKSRRRGVLQGFEKRPWSTAPRSTLRFPKGISYWLIFHFFFFFFFFFTFYRFPARQSMKLLLMVNAWWFSILISRGRLPFRIFILEPRYVNVVNFFFSSYVLTLLPSSIFF